VLQDYLMKYGYLTPQDPKTGALRSEEYVKNAVRAFQRMAGLPQTGMYRHFATLFCLVGFVRWFGWLVRSFIS
jgi:peptidoglycan hydrolase-like protein with peptidoglycan-binding domain